MVYLDITLLINGAMDAFLLFFTARVFRKKITPVFFSAAVMLGTIPVLLKVFGFSLLYIISKVLIPLAMVGVGLKIKSIGELSRCLLGFSLLAALTGGSIYVFTEWFGLAKIGENWELRNLWLLPVISLSLLVSFNLWEKLSKKNLYLDNVLYKIELDFGEKRQITLTALFDTGNDLRDPLTDKPVIVVEEKDVLQILPEKLKGFLELNWRQSVNPWSYLWKGDDYFVDKVVFIGAKGINGQCWLPGIRSTLRIFFPDNSVRELPVTAALVPQVLSKENRFQALLHPEHIREKSYKEEIA